MSTEDDCQAALKLHEDFLSELPNVVGIGIVEMARKEDLPGLAVGVYVSRKVPLPDLAPEHRIPGFLSIPGRAGPRDVIVRVLEQGVVNFENGLLERGPNA